ncbi:hypothetical protein O0L34_g355 [Tuta absoluta]|nr:hypothetical protein O0L34_g355 [Tuta absoluta]
MNFSVCFVVLSVVGNLKSVLSATDDEDEASENDDKKPSGVYLDTYAIYLIGFAMLLMFLAIIYLTYALIKARSQQYKVICDLSQSNGPATQTTFTRQESQVPICPNISNTTPITPIEDIVVENLFFPKNESAGNTHHLERNGTSTSTINKYESKVMPIVKRSVNSSLMLPPEQMREICKGVLQNRKSNKDLNELMESFERRPSRKLSKKGLAREKSASTPALDLSSDEIYDVLPAPTSTNKTDDYHDVKDKPAEQLCKSKEKNINDVKPIDDLEDLYDNPGVSVKKRVIVEDEEYLIVIDPALDPPSEPSYLNANTNDYIL